MTTDKERLAVLESDNIRLKEDMKSLKEDQSSWQKFCVRLVLKTGVSLMMIVTLGTFWGYLSPSAQEFIKGWIK